LKRGITKRLNQRETEDKRDKEMYVYKRKGIQIIRGIIEKAKTEIKRRRKV
jgi:hypothetical protein